MTAPVSEALRSRRPQANGAPARGVAQARRSTPMALVGVGCIVAAALLFVGLHLSLLDGRSVLVVARPVGPGQVIQDADLRATRVSADGGVALVPAAERSKVVGRTATVGLVPGSALSEEQLGASSGLQGDQAVIGLALKAGQLPPQLRAGDRVQVVDVGAKPGAGADDVRPTILTEAATVFTAPKDETKLASSSVVALVVPRSVGSTIAAAAAAGRVSLVLVPAP